MVSLNNAVCYDIETFPNCFTFATESFTSDMQAVWEISEFRDDRQELLKFFQWLSQTQTPMIGFNNVGFDYPVIHEFWNNPNITYQQLYAKAMQIIEGQDRFANTIWADNRFAPQIDLFKLQHFDNKAKSTSLKALQINMRSPSVVDMPVENGTILTKHQIDNYLIPYNKHDVLETKRFAQYSLEAIEFRLNLIEQFGVDVLNWNDTKIGEQMIIQKLGDEICYDRSSGYRRTRQTPRHQIALREIMFPYIRFENVEFNRILSYLQQQTLKAEEFKGDEEGTPVIITKGVFKNLTANVGGLVFHYGVGGIHASIERQRVIATDEWLIRDIDVKGLYPNVAIKNKLAPEHLGTRFTQVYSELPDEREKWQKKKGKKCAEANSYKLAANGAYGKSNSVFSPLFDPKFTMSITVNGQLLLSMLVEKLVKIPTLKFMQCNTDGITYYIHRDYEPYADMACREWEKITLLTLEDADYSAMYVRDVNNYIAVGKDRSVKLKGAYWTPDPLNYHKSITEAQPVAWHKNFSNVVSIRAAVAHMVHGVNIEQFIKMTTNPFDFICAVKIRRSDKLLWGGQEVQRNTRFYISNDGATLIKRLPAQGTLGAFKQANGVTDNEYKRIMKETGGAWDIRVCTKNKSRYDIRETSIMAGYNVTICNNITDFRFDNINYDWYLQEALKLVV